MSLLDKTNLLITPNAFKAGKLYSVIPASGTGDCTVVRNTTATRVNSSGLIVSSPVNTMRIDYTSGIPVLLNEPQSTNIFKPSNNFESWSKTNVVLNGLFFNDPSGNSIEGYDIATTGRMFSSYTGDGVSRFNNSIYIRANKIANLEIRDCANVNRTISVGTSFKRYDLSAISVSITTLFLIDNRNTQIADLKIWLYQAQVEIGSVATSIIPTTTTNVTRNADVITVSPPLGTVKITTTFSDDTTQVITSIPATFTAPQGLIKQVLMQSSL